MGQQASSGRLSRDGANDRSRPRYIHRPKDTPYNLMWKKKTEEAWTAELRAFGSGHAPANYVNLDFGAVCGGDDHAVLRAQVAALGATAAPSCVYGRKLPGFQANLRREWLSVGGGRHARHVTAALTDGEIAAAIDYGGATGGGMNVPLLDRAGRGYGFKIKYAEDTYNYRLVGPGCEYERFMVNNGVVKDVDEGKELFMQVWAFRSPALRQRVGKEYEKHPDGGVGFVVLFFDLDDDGLGDDILDDESIAIKQLARHHPGAAAAAGGVQPEEEDTE
ncbi:hypothetical protein QOZ80_5AG0374750 [Eleusine coracana subsp. coracana]|nr:hypothetical protein QOZ80_5AG0374750 [Eleusine coracana subsp. coracana]